MSASCYATIIPNRCLLLGLIVLCGLTATSVDGFIVNTVPPANVAMTMTSFQVHSARSSFTLAASQSEDDDETISSIPSIGCIDHVAMKTRNITTAMDFYGLFGFIATVKFRTGPARAAWLEQGAAGACRLELIEVPSFVLEETGATQKQAVNLMRRQDLLGQNHFALDVTGVIAEAGFANLTEYIDSINESSVSMFGKSLRVALAPQQKMIGRGVFELAFLYDADGALVELLNKQSELKQDIASGWEPWNTSSDNESK